MNPTNGTPSTALVRPSDAHYNQAAAAIERTGFGTHEIERRRETQATAMAKRAEAEVQAFFIMAMQRPRSPETAWQLLIKECQRASFAEAGMYRLTKGRKKDDATGQWVDNVVEGLTIGFATTALRLWRNVNLTEGVIYDDEDKVVYQVVGVDAESIIRMSREVTIAKTIERSDPDGRIVLGERKNSRGRTTYIVVPTEDEMESKIASRASKKRRDVILALLPADLKDDCKATIKQTLQAADRKDPELAKKKMLAAYIAIGITADELVKFVGHPLEQVTEDEMEELRGIHAAIKEGETTWPEALREKLEGREPDNAAAAEKPADKTAQAIKDKLAPQTSNGKPATDKQPTKKTAGWYEARRKTLAASMVWSRNGDRHLGAVEDLEITIEQTGPMAWGWWLSKAGVETEDGDALDFEMAKGKAIEAASRL